jgi:hypothetical protein
MLGTWTIVDNISDRLYAVRCNLCGFTTQKPKSKMKNFHRCPSIIDNTKYCYKCEVRKDLEFFHKDASVSGGYSKLCRECYAERVNVTNFSYKPVNRRPVTQKVSRQRVGKRLIPLYGIEKFLHERQISLRYRHKNNTFKAYNLPDGYLFELYKKQNGKCYYTGYQFDYTSGFSANSISIDRLYPLEGYTVDNIVLCTHSINMMKLNMNVDEFKKYLSTIKEGLETFILN